MTAPLVTLLFAVAVFTTAEVLRRLFIRARSQPIWAISKTVGGVFAVCPMDDYIRVKAAGTMAGGKVLVRRTLAFRSDNRQDQNTRPYRIFWYSWMERSVVFSEANDLFVPFASEAHMSYVQQREFFMPPPKDFGAFVATIVDENPLRRLAYRLDPLPGRWTSVTSTAARLSGVIVIFSMFWLAGAYHLSSASAKNEELEKAASYTTDANGLHKTEVAKDDQYKMLVYPDDTISTDIYHGKVSSIAPLSAGMVLACADRKNDHPLCGVAPPSVRIGDEAFIRSQDVCDWQFPDHSRCGYYSVTNWIITKGEADLLVSTGKFRIVD